MALKFYKANSDYPTHVDLTQVFFFCMVLRHREVLTLLALLNNFNIRLLVLIVRLKRKYINMNAVNLDSSRSFPEASEGNETASKGEI